MPQPTKAYRINLLTEDEKTVKDIFTAFFPEVPQVGWTLIFDGMFRTSRGCLSDVAGIVKNVVMLSNCQEVIVYVKEIQKES